MSDTCPRPIIVCDKQLVQESTAASCPDWDVCLPWGARLYQRDGCVRYEAGTPPPDGVYGQFAISNGCFITAEEYPVPKYQSDPCAPVPCPCDSADGGDSNLCNPSTVVGNLYSCDATGKPLVKAYIEGGDNVTVTGAGTSTNPFKISISLGDAGVTSLVSGSSCLTVSPNVGAVTITHSTGYNKQTINGMVFDEYGHLVDYSESSATSEISGVIGTNGIAATNTNGIITVELEKPATSYSGEYVFGGFRVTLNAYNQITGLSNEITGMSGTYAFGAYDVTLNEYGSVTEIAESYDSSCFAGNYTHTSEAVTQRSVTFELRYPARLMVDVYANAPTAAWADSLKFYLDDDPMANTVSFVSGSVSRTFEDGTATVYATHVRLLASGIFRAGTHTLLLQHSAGFPLHDMLNIQVTPMTNFTESSTVNTGD